MPQLTRYWPLGGSQSAVLGSGWTNPTLVAVSDGSDASAAVADTGQPQRANIYTNWGIKDLLPSNAVITSVKLEVRGRVAGQTHVLLEVRNHGASIHQFSYANTTETSLSFDYTSFRSWDRDDFGDDQFSVWLECEVTGGGGPFSRAGSGYCDYMRMVIDYTLTPQTIVTGKATETDSAQAVTRAKRKAIGQPSSSHSTFAVAFKKSGPLGQAEETDEALALQRGAVSEDIFLSWLGSGVDGDIVIDSSSYTLADPFDPSVNLIDAGVLMRPLVCRTLTIAPGVKLEISYHGGSPPAPVFPIYVSDLFTNEGVIKAYRDFDGTTSPYFYTDPAVAGTSGNGGAGNWAGLGGKGGNGGNGSGGRTGGTAHRKVEDMGGASLLQLLASGPVRAGGPGGAGGGDGTNPGGDGGYPGPGIFIAARRFDNTNGIVESVSSQGFTNNTGNVGGGGGAGGGVILVVSSVIVGLGQLLAAGGSPGRKHGTGTDGEPGEQGRVILVTL